MSPSQNVRIGLPRSRVRLRIRTLETANLELTTMNTTTSMALNGSTQHESFSLLSPLPPCGSTCESHFIASASLGSAPR